MPDSDAGRLRSPQEPRCHSAKSTRGVVWAIGEQIAGMALTTRMAACSSSTTATGNSANCRPVTLAMGEIEATLEYEALGDRQDRGRLLLDGTAQTPWQALSPTLMARLS